jgi:hypothetical protein
VLQPNIIIAYNSFNDFIANNAPGKQYSNLESFLKNEHSLSDAEYSSKAVVVDGVTGHWLFVKDATTVFFQKNSSVYIATFWTQKTYDQLPSEPKSILSTLRFTN